MSKPCVSGLFRRPSPWHYSSFLTMAAMALFLFMAPSSRSANVLQVFFAPFPEDDMQISLDVISSQSGAIGTEVRTVTSIVAGNNGTIIYYDHWEDGYEADISAPTQSTTVVWGDNDPTNGIPPGFTQDVVNAGTIINLEATIDVLRNQVIFEYDGRDKIASTLPITMARANYPITPGEVIAEAGTALDVAMHGTNYIAAVGWGTGSPLYTNEVFEYTAFYIMGDYDYTFVEVDKDADGVFETSAWINQGERLFVNGGVRVGARARGNLPFQCHLVTGDIGANYETRWYTQWPVEKWSSEYFSPVGGRSNTAVGILYKALVFFYNPNTNSIDVVCETATATSIITVAANSPSGAFTMPENGGARFFTTNGAKFFASSVFDGSTPAVVGQLQDYDWGFSLLPRDALSTMAIVGWGPGYGVTGVGTTNGNPAWVMAVSNTTLYVDYDGDPTTGPLTDPLGNKYNFSTNLVRYQAVYLYDNTDTNQTGMRFYTLDGVKISSAWGIDPRQAAAGLPYIDAGYEIMPFPSVLAEKFSTLLIDNNSNGLPDPGDQLEYTIEVRNVGFATANNVTFLDNPPSNITAYVTNSAHVNGVQIFDDLPPKITRFPFDEGGYNIGTIDIGGTTIVRYVTEIINAIGTNFDGYIHNNAVVGSTNSTWQGGTFTNVLVGGITLTKNTSTTNILNPGDSLTYTMAISNTGQVIYTGLRLEDLLPVGVTYVSNSTFINYPFGMTNTVRDRFDSRSYTNTTGSIQWLNAWQEEGESDGAPAGSVGVTLDAGVYPAEAYALYIGNTNRGIWRSANLSGHSSAILSFNYRRAGLDDINDFVDLFISTNNWASSNFLVRFAGPANETNTYLSTNIDVSVYISTNTSIKFRTSNAVGMTAPDQLWVDNITFTLTGSNVTFAGSAPPVLFQGLSLPPGTSIVVAFSVTMDSPPAATQLVNTARVRADQQAQWLYATSSNGVNARAALEIFKTNNPSGQVGPGSNITYTIEIRNTGDVAQTSIQLQDFLPIGVTYVTNSAWIWRPFLHTNDVLDVFNARAYTNNDGNLHWAGPWVEIGDDNNPTSGYIQVRNDGASIPGHVFALRTSFTTAIQRAINLGGGYTNAILSFEWRRHGLDATTDYLSIFASSNNGSAWTEVGRIAGPGTDASYYVSNINISAFASTGTLIRFTATGMAVDDYVWLDDVRVRFSSSNGTNALWAAPTNFFSGYYLPPYTSMWITLQVTVDDPALATQLVNTARVRSDQYPDWLYAYVTNWQSGSFALTVSKTSSVSGHAWSLYETNTYTITIANTGTLVQTGVTVWDPIPSGAVYVAGSATVVYPALLTNIVTNVTSTAYSESVADQFNNVAYTNNNGTISWLNNWAETGDDGNPATGSVRIQNDGAPTSSIVWIDTAADNDYVTRTAPLTNAPGLTITNVTLSFAYRRVNWDLNDSFTIYVSTNNFAAQSNLVWQMGGATITDPGYTSVVTNITSFIGTNLWIRMRGGPNFALGDAIYFDYLVLNITGYVLSTNITTNVFWGAATNTGGTPPWLASGYTLPTGTTLTVTFKATLPFPTAYEAITNLARVWSVQQTNLWASVTDNVHRVTIGDWVWYDVNTNGIQDFGEVGVSGVVVRLYDGQTNLLATTTTSVNGYYYFTGWPPTNYFVEFVRPSNYWFTARDQGGDDSIDSDADTNTGRTVIFSLGGPTNDLRWDAGLYIPPSSIGDWVWFDANANGIQDAGETGVAGVVVRLYDSSSNLVATTTNNASGYYLFTGIMPGSYFLEFVPPTNYAFTLQDQGSSDTNDSDVAQSTGRTAIFYLFAGTNDTSRDAGLVLPTYGLRITKTSDAGGSCWEPGSTGTYTIIVVNTGVVAQSNVSVEDIFPPGVSFLTNSVSISAPGSGFTGTPPVLAYGYTLAAGQGMTVTVQVVIDKPATTNILLNQARTYSATHPAISAWHTNCVSSTDLGVTKDVTDTTPNEIEYLMYTLTITNNGPGTATGMQILDVLPSQVQYNWHSNGTYNVNNGIWDIGTLPVGAATSLYIHCTVREGTLGLYITNTATLYAINEFDTVSTNNTDKETIHPTLVVVSRFEVLADAAGPAVEWETAYEHGTVGFFLYRKGDGDADFVRLNSELLPAVLSAPQGGIYRYRDASAEPQRTYSYRLDEVTVDGSIHAYGPFTVTVPAAVRLSRTVASSSEVFTRNARTSDATLSRLARAVSETLPLESRVVRSSRRTALRDVRDVPDAWPPVKISTVRPGIHAVSAAALAAALGENESDVRAALASGNVAMDNLGQPVSFATDGTQLWFYAESWNTIYTTVNVYRIRWTLGNQVQELGGVLPVPAPGGFFTDLLDREEDRVSFISAPHETHEDFWYWNFLIAEHSTLGQSTYALNPAAPAGIGSASLVVRLRGGSTTGVTNEHRVQAFLNDVLIGETSWSGLNALEWTNIFDSSLLGATNTLMLKAMLGDDAGWSVVYVDGFSLAYARQFAAVNNQLILRAGTQRVVTVTGFTTNTIHVWDLTDPARPVRLTGVSVDHDGTAWRASFVPRYATTPYIVWAVPQNPVSVTARHPGDLLAATNTARYVLIAPSDLAATARDLADYREAESGLPARVVLLQDIYDLFGYGIEHPPAIRDFLQWALENWNPADERPFYVVLVGEGTFDHRNVTGAAQNKVPVIMVGTPQGLCASDGWFADFDDDGVPEMAVGRLPVLSNAELQTMLARIVNYETAEGGSWRQTVLLAADNPDDGGDFDSASESVADLIAQDYAFERVYLSSLSLSTARTQLQTRINAGVSFINYFGHAGIDRLAAESLLLNSDIPALRNSNKLPILVSLTCAMGQYALPNFDSLAETLLLATGGAVAVWAPNSVSLNHSSFMLADRFYRSVFANGLARVGDGVQAAKRLFAEKNGSTQVLSSYNLLGDPALRLRGTPFLGDSSYEDWARTVFTAAELANPDYADELADPDGDGVENLWEYATGWNPRRAEGGSIIQVRRDPEEPLLPYDVIFYFRHRKTATDAEFRLEVSRDLKTWGDAGAYIQQVEVEDDPLDNAWIYLVYVRVPPEDVVEPLFLRLFASRSIP